jgi:hypothetical protein
MLSATLTATLFWLASSAGSLPTASAPTAAPARENIYYVQLDGMT